MEVDKTFVRGVTMTESLSEHFNGPWPRMVHRAEEDETAVPGIPYTIQAFTCIRCGWEQANPLSHFSDLAPIVGSKSPPPSTMDHNKEYAFTAEEMKELALLFDSQDYFK